MDTSNDIAVLILAAGESARMGEPKQLLPWKGTTLLGNAITTAESVNAGNIYVVLGAHSEAIEKSIDLNDVVSIYNPNYKSGQGSSLSCGIDYLLGQQKSYKGVIITLCDQPLISSAYLSELIQTFKQGKKGIVATDYGSRAGVPAIFDRKYFDELKNIKGDEGAKKILEVYRKDLATINPKGKEQDLDTPEEYQALAQQKPE